MEAARANAAAAPTKIFCATFILLVVGPIPVAVFLYRIAEIDAAPLPDQGSWFSPLAVPAHNKRILGFSERLGDGLLLGPEDLAYDAEANVIYTGCRDGWIKKVTVSAAKKEVSVENWANVGGRPLGIAIDADNQLAVADAYRGLLRVTKDGKVEVLSNEAEGVRFGLPNCVDVAASGMVYFTDSSYKYNLDNFAHDAIEGRPYGRLMSYNTVTNETRVLVRDLYFANGVALPQKEDFLVFCETTMRRCRKYNIEGDRKGLLEDFIDNLPGFPDNVHYYDGHFWIALTSGRTLSLFLYMRYPFVRKTLAILERLVKLPRMSGQGGVLCVSMDGKAIALYSDPALYSVTSALKIGSSLYYGSLSKAYISRVDIQQHPALAM